MRTHWIGIGRMVVVLALLAGCAGRGSGTPPVPPPPPLRVGVNPDYPPLVYKTDGRIAGLEADLAQQVAERLGRRLEFVERRWDRLIPALNNDEIDVVMSGMSVTDARQLRVAFTEPYMLSGLLALVRFRDAVKYDTIAKIEGSDGRIGVKGGTTGEVFVQRRCPQATPVVLAKPIDAVYELRRGTIDLFIHDWPYVAWLVSTNEADFTASWAPLTRERLAWAVRRNDTALLDALNAALAAWKADGSLARAVERWVPHGQAAD